MPELRLELAPGLEADQIVLTSAANPTVVLLGVDGHVANVFGICSDCDWAGLVISF
jgi:hypothetical protein